MIKTVNPALSTIRQAQASYRECLTTERDISKLRDKTWAYEDVLNGLTGEYATFSPDVQAEIQTENYNLFLLAQDKGIELQLYESLMPMVSTSTTSQKVLRTGKKIYPKTITFFDSSLSTSSNVQIRATPAATLPPANEPIADDVVDDAFDAVDAITYAPATYASEQVNEPWTPMVSNALVELALTAASNANGLQAGLTTFSHNPLDSIIEDSRDLLIYYTENNYANLNVALSGISSNPALNSAYKLLRESIGGSDGLSGCVAQLDEFRIHTDRLSGLYLDNGSPESEPTNDSITEDLTLYGLSGGPTEIFSFSARKFRSAKYLIQATAADADRGHTVTEIFILHDNHHPYTREVVAMYSNEPFVTYTTQLVDGEIRVLANTAADNTDFVIHGTRLQISRAAKSYANVSQTKILEHHSILSTFLNDGVDYVRYQSGALYNPKVVAEISREMRDLLIQLRSSDFLGQSDAVQSAGINVWATTIATRANTIQAQIDDDYSHFVECRKKSEALQIAFSLAAGYEQPNANTTLQSTLNTVTKAAIQEQT